MNDYKVMYSPVAKEDLFSIYSYIATQLLEPQIAKSQTNRIRNAIRSLESMPNRYSRVDWEPWLSMGMRKLPVNNHIVFYRVEENTALVKIDRIVYSGRDLQNILSNSEIE